MFDQLEKEFNLQAEAACRRKSTNLDNAALLISAGVAANLMLIDRLAGLFVADMLIICRSQTVEQGKLPR